MLVVLLQILINLIIFLELLFIRVMISYLQERLTEVTDINTNLLRLFARLWQTWEFAVKTKDGKQTGTELYQAQVKFC